MAGELGLPLWLFLPLRPLSIFIPYYPAFFQFLKHIKFIPTSGPLHLHFLCLEPSCPCLYMAGSFLDSAQMPSSLQDHLWPPSLEEALSMACTTSSNCLFAYLLFTHYHLTPCKPKLLEDKARISLILLYPQESDSAWPIEDTVLVNTALINIGSIKTLIICQLLCLKLYTYLCISSSKTLGGVGYYFSASYSWLLMKPEMKARPTWYLSPFSSLPLCFAVLWETRWKLWWNKMMGVFFNLELLSTSPKM